MGDGRVEEADVGPVPGNDFLRRYRHVVALDSSRSVTVVHGADDLIDR